MSAVVFICDPVVAAHYNAAVGTFITLPDAEAAYLMNNYHAFSVWGKNIAPAWGKKHAQAPPFVPYAPGAPSPPPPPPSDDDDCGPKPTTTKGKKATK
jgi:hypothetical protein